MLHRKLNPYIAILLVTIIASGLAYWLLWRINAVESVDGEDFFPTTVRRHVSSATEDTTDTSTWKTYRNEEYGLEMKYPPDWNVGISKYDESVVQFEKQETNTRPTDCDEVLSIRVLRRTSMDTALQKVGFDTKEQILEGIKILYENDPEWIEEQSVWISANSATYYTEGGIFDPRVTAVEEIEISGHQGYKGTSFAPCYYDEGGRAGSGEAARVLLVGNDSTYAIMHIFGDDEGALSTFKFTK